MDETNDKLYTEKELVRAFVQGAGVCFSIAKKNYPEIGEKDIWGELKDKFINIGVMLEIDGKLGKHDKST